MHWLWIALGIGIFFLYIWVVMDAFDHSGYGCAWLAFFICFPGISILIYLFIRFYANRPDINPNFEMGEANQQTYSRFPTEIEKARFIEAADHSLGTMYEPGASATAVGYPHFRDDRAELLLSEGRFDEAWNYLIDLYAVAKSEADGRREDTYLHYISRLPKGTDKLAHWRRDQRLEIGSDSADDQAPPPNKPPTSRDVPF